MQLSSQFSSGTYTHHQKSVIVDCKLKNGDGRRGLSAFVGGLDLTDGRWDTPEHQLFSTLLEEHREDFYQKNAPSIPASQGPRQPWRDIHCRLDGPAAADVFANFYERWSKQAGKYGHLGPLDRSM